MRCFSVYSFFKSVEGIVVLPTWSSRFPEPAFLTIGGAGQIQVFALHSGRSIARGPSALPGTELVEIAHLPNSRFLVTVNNSQDILFHSLPTMEVHKHVVGYNDEVVDVKFLTDEYLAVATNSPEV